MALCQTCTAHYQMVCYYGIATKLYNRINNYVFRLTKNNQPNGLAFIIHITFGKNFMSPAIHIKYEGLFVNSYFLWNIKILYSSATTKLFSHPTRTNRKNDKIGVRSMQFLRYVEFTYLKYNF